jgi:hypothetical protein
VEGGLTRPWAESAWLPQIAEALARLARAVYDAGRHPVARNNLRPGRIAMDSRLAPDATREERPPPGE